MESSQTGGYPVPVDLKLDPINQESPIYDKEWRDPAPVADLTSVFCQVASQPFSIAQARRAAQAANDLINQTGARRRALHCVGECKMLAQAHLVEQAIHHLGAYPDLWGDICELYRLWEIPKFRGPSPGTFRARGLPRNPNDQTFIMTKLWQYVVDGGNVLAYAQRNPPVRPIPVFTVNHGGQKIAWPRHLIRQAGHMGWATC